VHLTNTEDAVLIPAKPQLKPWYRWTATNGAIVFEHGQTAVVFEGRAAERLLPLLLPLLDGTHSVAELVDVLGAAAEPAVANALALLAERGLLADADAGPAAGLDDLTETETFLAAMSPTTAPAIIRDRLGAVEVDVAGSGPAAGTILGLLHDCGVGLARGVGLDEALDGGATAGSFAVVVPGAAEISQLAEWNRRAIADGRPWLQVLPFDGRFAAIGPLFVPGETCCYACYRTRRAATSGYGGEFLAVDETPLEAGGGPAIAAAVAGVAGVVAVRWLALSDHHLPGVLFALEGRGTSLTQHRVYRVPRCAACSGLREAAPPLPWFKEVGEPLDANGALA
jgi:bacteriocin biosynthesis cyclodehydratase domain-containing protein